MAEWAELESSWNTVNQQIGTEKAKLSPREAGVVYGFAEEVYQAVQGLKDLDARIQKGGPNPPAFRDLFKAVLQNFHAVASGGPTPGGGEVTRKLMNLVWGWGIEAITSFLERRAKDIYVDSWSMGVTAGLPTGISATLEVTFRRS